MDYEKSVRERGKEDGRGGEKSVEEKHDGTTTSAT